MLAAVATRGYPSRSEFWRVRLVVRTQPSQGWCTGSTPVRAALPGSIVRSLARGASNHLRPRRLVVPRLVASISPLLPLSCSPVIPVILSCSLLRGLTLATSFPKGEAKASFPRPFVETHSTSHSSHQRSVRALTTNRLASPSARPSTNFCVTDPAGLTPHSLLRADTSPQSPNNAPAIETSDSTVCDRRARSFP